MHAVAQSKSFTIEQIIAPKGPGSLSRKAVVTASQVFTIEQIIAPKGADASAPGVIVPVVDVRIIDSGRTVIEPRPAATGSEAAPA